MFLPPQHLLGLRAGEQLKLISKASHPWWEAESKSGVVGFVPFNYVLATNKSDSLSQRDSSADTHSDADSSHTASNFVDDSDDPENTLRVTIGRGASSPLLNRLAVVQAMHDNKSKYAGEVANPLYKAASARPASKQIPQEPVSEDPLDLTCDAPVLETPAADNVKGFFKGQRSRSAIGPPGETSGDVSPSSKRVEKDALKRSFPRQRSQSNTAITDHASGDTSPLRASGITRSRSRAASIAPASLSLFGMTLAMVMPRAHSPPIFLVRILAKLEGSRGIEAPNIFLEEVDPAAMAAMKQKLHNASNDFSCIQKETNPHMVARLLIEWLQALPLSVIPPDMFNLFSEAEKIHTDEEHFFHVIHSLVNSLPKAHRTCLQYVCFIFKNAVAVSEKSGTTLDKLAPVVAPIIMRPRTGSSLLVVSNVNATIRMSNFKKDANLSELHIDELPPMDAAVGADADTQAKLKAEYERRSKEILPGVKTFKLLIEHFLELFMNEGTRMRFTTKAGDARDVLSAGSMDVIVHKLYDKNYVDMLDPEFPHIVLLTRDYFVDKDVELLRELHGAYMQHKDSMIPWEETIRLRVVNLLKLFTDNYLPENGVVDKEFVTEWKQFLLDMQGEQNTYGRAIVDQLLQARIFAEGSSEAILEAEDAAKKRPPLPLKTKSECVLIPKTDLHDLAVALTVHSSHLFGAILPVELMHRNWQTRETSPNYTGLVDNFALYQSWAVHQILTASDKDRSRVATQLVDLCFHLRELQNFHVCFALYAGVAHPSVERLKMWEKLGKLKDRLVELKALFDPSSNHKAYQTALRACQGAVIPQISIYSKYLFAIEENNDDWVIAKPKPGSTPVVDAPKGERMVNVEKLRMLYVLIKQLRQYQRFQYNLRPTSNELFAQIRCGALPTLADEKALYDLSLKIQPRAQ